MTKRASQTLPLVPPLAVCHSALIAPLGSSDWAPLARRVVSQCQEDSLGPCPAASLTSVGELQFSSLLPKQMSDFPDCMASNSDSQIQAAILKMFSMMHWCP